MVRNDVKGYSFVEIMVSMTILAIVVLFITNILTTSTKRHQSTRGEDLAYVVAKEILTQLQNENVQKNTKAGSGGKIIIDELVLGGVPTALTDIERDGMIYSAECIIFTESKPDCVWVNVRWNKVGEVFQDSTESVGFIDGGVCSELTNNTAPSQVAVYDLNGDLKSEADIFDPAKHGFDVDDVVNINNHPDKSNRFVARLKPVDVDIEKGDIVTLTITNDPSSNFKISNDSLYSIGVLNSITDYDIEIRAEDCAGQKLRENDSKKKITISVKPDIDDPVVYDTILLLDEAIEGGSFTTNTGFGFVKADQSAVDWSLVGGGSLPFKVEVTGEIKTKFTGSAPHTIYDYEGSQNQWTLTVKAISGQDNTKKGTGTVTVKLKNVNERPYDISVSPKKISSSALSGDTIGIITVLDPEDNVASVGVTHPAYFEVVKKEIDGKPIFFLVLTNSLTNNITPSFTATDNNGLTSSPVLITIEVGPPNEFDCTDPDVAPEFVLYSHHYIHAKDTVYIVGSQVSYEGYAYEARKKVSNSKGTPLSQPKYWKRIGNCQ